MYSSPFPTRRDWELRSALGKKRTLVFNCRNRNISGMNILKINAAADRLRIWTQTLLNHIDSDTSNYGRLRDILNDKTPIGKAPSKESLAAICLQEVEQDIEELRAAFEEIKTEISGGK